MKASLPDVVRFCRTLELPFFAAFTLERSADQVRGLRLGRDDRISDPEDGWSGFVEVRLRRREGGGCIGLTELGGYTRCGVYGARPMNCRLYPVAWEDERGRGGPDAVLCPAPFAVTPGVAAQVETDAATARRYWDVHEAVIAEWNGLETEATLEAALSFLLGRAAEELKVELPSVALTSGTPDQRLTDELAERGMLMGGPPLGGPEPFAGLPPFGRPT